MVHNRNKKALYEVIGKNWPKTHYDKTLQREEQPTTTESPVSMPMSARWPRKPRIMQFNIDRIEFSIPYQLAIALLLVFILLILVVFRLGQSSGGQKEAAPSTEIPRKPQAEVFKAPAGALPAVAKTESTPAKPAPVREAVLSDVKGNNRIVIQTYRVRAHLEPVEQYFAQFGIETEIKVIDNWYYLVTKDKYENPEKAGTDGYLAKQRIIQLGAKYKAPAGYETFGSNPFHDAYGRRFDD